LIIIIIFSFFFYGVESKNFFFILKNSIITLGHYSFTLQKKSAVAGHLPGHLPFQQCNEKTSKDDNSKPFGFSFLFFWEFYGTETNRYSQALHILNEEDLASDFCEILCSLERREKKSIWVFFFCEEQILACLCSIIYKDRFIFCPKIKS
jgi:hypothetical protein